LAMAASDFNIVILVETVALATIATSGRVGL
jgi:hypothetical protein